MTRMPSIPSFNKSAADRFGRLPRGCRRLRVFSVVPRQHHEIGIRRKDEGLSHRQLGSVEAVVVAGGSAAKAVVLRVARLHDDARRPAVTSGAAAACATSEKVFSAER